LNFFFFLTKVREHAFSPQVLSFQHNKLVDSGIFCGKEALIRFLSDMFNSFPFQ